MLVDMLTWSQLTGKTFGAFYLSSYYRDIRTKGFCDVMKIEGMTYFATNIWSVFYVKVEMRVSEKKEGFDPSARKRVPW